MNILNSIVAATLITLLVFVFLKERKTSRFYLPGILRIIIVILLLFMLFELRFQLSIKQEAKIPILVLVDNSKSFATQENSSLIDLVLKKIRSFKARTQFYLFSDTVFPLKNFMPPRDRTDIAQALSYALTKKPGAVVLFSDGLHNQNRDPITVVQNALCPIYTIGLGDETQKDIYIEDLQYPSRSFLSDTLVITCRIGNYQFSNYITNITLKRKSEVIQKQSVVITTPNTVQEVVFKVLPKTTGRHLFSVEIDSGIDEENYKNNRRDFSIEVIRNRYTIIYITNAPSFNTRFILDALKNNKEAEFQVYPYIAFTGRNYQSITTEPLEKVASSCDLVILDDINENQLTSEIKSFLNNQLNAQKGFLILVQENFSPQEFLREILPGDYSKKTIIKQDLVYNITPEARQTPIFFNNEGKFLLEKAAPFLGANAPTNLKPGAVVWLYNPDKNLPLIINYRYRGSKIVLITGFPIFRLGFSGNETETQKLRFYEFWGNLIRYLALADIKNFQILADKKDYLVGEKVKITLYATTPDGRYWSGLNIWAHIPQFKNELPFYEYQPGIYEAEFNAESPGEILVKIKIA
ncbi:MAG: vWA domain-containing protein, partial [candidate division WOR-3 bacterium]|nr:vWA domain-containing protein [candidate division WOR-3 bacterium]